MRGMGGRGQGTKFVTPHKPVPFVGVPGVSGILEGYYLIGQFPFTDMTCVTDVLSQGGIDPSIAMQPWHTPRHALTKINANTLATSSTV